MKTIHYSLRVYSSAEFKCGNMIVPYKYMKKVNGRNIFNKFDIFILGNRRMERGNRRRMWEWDKPTNIFVRINKY